MLKQISSPFNISIGCQYHGCYIEMIQGIGPHGLISPGSSFIGIMFPKKTRKLLIVGITGIIGFFVFVWLVSFRWSFMYDKNDNEQKTKGNDKEKHPKKMCGATGQSKRMSECPHVKLETRNSTLFAPITHLSPGQKVNHFQTSDAGYGYNTLYEKGKDTITHTHTHK